MKISCKISVIAQILLYTGILHVISEIIYYYNNETFSVPACQFMEITKIFSHAGQFSAIRYVIKQSIARIMMRGTVGDCGYSRGFCTLVLHFLYN